MVYAAGHGRAGRPGQDRQPSARRPGGGDPCPRGRAGRGRRRSWSPSTARSPAASAASSLGRLQLRKVEVARLEAEASGRELAWALGDYRPDLLAAQQALLEARNAAQTSRREALAKAMQTRRGEMRTAAAEVEPPAQQPGAAQAAARGGAGAGRPRPLSRAEGGPGRAPVQRRSGRARQGQGVPGRRRGRAGGGRQPGSRAWRPSGCSEVLGELAQATADRDRLAEQLRAQDAILASLEVAAPAAGIVQEIVVTAPGQAVAAHETLMKLVPAERGPGRRRPRSPTRMSAACARACRPRSRCAPSTICASARSRACCRRSPPTPRPTRAPASSTYAVTVVTARAPSGRGPGEFDVAPGMVVDVDLKIGERTILSYLTDRIFRLQEAFREG